MSTINITKVDITRPAGSASDLVLRAIVVADRVKIGPFIVRREGDTLRVEFPECLPRRRGAPVGTSGYSIADRAEMAKAILNSLGHAQTVIEANKAKPNTSAQGRGAPEHDGNPVVFRPEHIEQNPNGSLAIRRDSLLTSVNLTWPSGSERAHGTLAYATVKTLDGTVLGLRIFRRDDVPMEIEVLRKEPASSTLSPRRLREVALQVLGSISLSPDPEARHVIRRHSEA